MAILQLGPADAHFVFDGSAQTLKAFMAGGKIKFTLPCHDIGVWDGKLADPFGKNSKCPPGDYEIGYPQPCAIRQPNGGVRLMNDDDKAYGCFFTPLKDTSDQGMFKHGRAGIGIHGGGSAAPDPFAMHQGWYPTLGCFRLQNQDNEQIFVPFIKSILKSGGQVYLTVTQDKV